MKKLVFIMPLMAISLLASCSNNGNVVIEKYNVYFKCTDCALYENDTKITQGPILLNKGESKTFLVKLDAASKYFDVTADCIGDCVSFDPGTNQITITNINENVSIFARSEAHIPLEEFSWSAINDISKTGIANRYFNIGEEKTVLINEMPHKVRIIDFDHDELADQNGFAGITFEFANLISKSISGIHIDYHWDESNNYDFTNSILNDYLNGSSEMNEDEIYVYESLPADLQNVIKTVNKHVATSTDSGETFSSETPYPTKLFPLAYYEMTNKTHTGIGVPDKGEGSIYKYYESEKQNLRIKYDVMGDFSYTYWLRSPTINISAAPDYYAFCVFDNGFIAEENATTSSSPFSVAPAFCI